MITFPPKVTIHLESACYSFTALSDLIILTNIDVISTAERCSEQRCVQRPNPIPPQFVALLDHWPLMDQYWATTDVDWFWLILIDSDQFWSILIDATGCWLILIDDNGYWLILIDTDRSIFLFVVRCLFPSFFNEQNSLYRGENCARSLSSKPTLPSVQI